MLKKMIRRYNLFTQKINKIVLMVLTTKEVKSKLEFFYLTFVLGVRTVEQRNCLAS